MVTHNRFEPKHRPAFLQSSSQYTQIFEAFLFSVLEEKNAIHIRVTRRRGVIRLRPPMRARQSPLNGATKNGAAWRCSSRAAAYIVRRETVSANH